LNRPSDDDEKTRIIVEQFNADISRDPNDAYVYADMGIWWHWEGQYAKALQHLNKAIALDPQLSYALCARAGLLSTCPDAAYRDGTAAVRDATAALTLAQEKGELTTNWKRRMYLETLAAAHAELGAFDVASEIQRKALEFALTLWAERDVNDGLSALELRQPIRSDRGFVRFGVRRSRHNRSVQWIRQIRFGL